MVLAFGATAVSAAPQSVLPEDSVSNALENARHRMDEAERRLAELEAQRGLIEAEHGSLTETQLKLARELEAALASTNQFAVAQYVSGGPLATFDHLLGTNDATEAMWRAEVLTSQVEHGLEAASDLRELVGRADSAVRQIAYRTEQNRAKVESASAKRFFAGLDFKAAEQQLLEARLARARLAQALFDAPPQSATLAEAWGNLRSCESGGNYRAVSPSGVYRGAYQFDLRTWAGVGGSGDPINASPAEQDLRAQILYDQRGKRPWPLCGRYLP